MVIDDRRSHHRPSSIVNRASNGFGSNCISRVRLPYLTKNLPGDTIPYTVYDMLYTVCGIPPGNRLSEMSPTQGGAPLPLTITNVTARDIRFPTSRTLDGSDAMNRDPDYSAAYVVLKTDDPALEGHGLTFTIGRGNERCVAAIDALKYLVVGKTLESFTADMGAFWRMITGDSQLRWVGPEKGVIHLATAALVNAVWDLYAKATGKPLWK